MLRKRSVSLVSCKYEAVIESAWKQTKVRVWVKKLWSWTQKADRQQAARPSAACRNYADSALLPRLHSTPGPAFSFFSPVVLSPPPGWAGLRSGRADWLHYLGTLNSRHGIVMMTFAARQYLITDHSSLVFRTAFYSTTYSVPGSISIYSEGNAGLLFCLALYSVIACQNFSLSSGLAHLLISIQLQDRCKQSRFL